MKIFEIDSFSEETIVRNDGTIHPCIPSIYRWLIDHSWFIYQKHEDQAAQSDYDPEVHPFIWTEISTGNFKRTCESTVIAGGTSSYTEKESATKKEKANGKWTLYFYSPWRENPVFKVKMRLYKLKLIKEVLPHVGIMCRASAIYSPKFCRVKVTDKCIVVRNRFNIPDFKFTLGRNEDEEIPKCVLLQLLYDMKTHHTSAFESLVQTDEHERLPLLRILFEKKYKYCFNGKEKILPSAHEFTDQLFLKEQILIICQEVLFDNNNRYKLEQAMKTVNTYLSTWKIQGASRRRNVDDLFRNDIVCALQPPKYVYMSMQPDSITMTIEEIFELWSTNTHVKVKGSNFDIEDVELYTQSIDCLMLGYDKKIECLPFTDKDAPVFIANFKELIHCFWFLQGRFTVQNSSCLYRENNKYNRELSPEIRDKLLNIKVTFLFWPKIQ